MAKKIQVNTLFGNIEINERRFEGTVNIEIGKTEENFLWFRQNNRYRSEGRR